MKPQYATKCTLLLFMFLVSQIHGELLMAVWVIRHGAREPNHPKNEILKEFGKEFVGKRLLTNVGMRQQYILGRMFQDKYRNEIDFSPASVVIRATDRSRTFKSSLSFLRGFDAKPAKPYIM